MRQRHRNLPLGAVYQRDGSVVWRVWAPLCESIRLVTFSPVGRREIAMTPLGDGHFVHRARDVPDGLRYFFGLGENREYPDPASRWQPEGVHKPSAVFRPTLYPWSDGHWQGVRREDLVIYELHVGTFTPEGTFEAAIPRLPRLYSLGVTAVEVMPVAQFPGSRNWGYDGVYPYAVQNSYGGPRGFQGFVDAAHRNGLAVILDVVYNHLGPEGNYLAQFGPYFTDRYHTPWGLAVNFDGAHSDPVRQFFINNACTWVRDFHVDGLRLDAVQTIYDFSPLHILAEIQVVVRREAARQRRIVHVIAETNQNDVRLVRPRGRGGFGLDGVWSDDFHHSIHALLTGERDGYYLDFGKPAHAAKAFSDVFVYDGCYSPFHCRRQGSRVGSIDRSRFVVCIQNHDQVGNRASGDRLDVLLTPAARRLACALLLLSPCVPLLFMGEEYGEQRPFPFFCSFDDAAIIEAVRSGRRREFTELSFRWRSEIPDPQTPGTFAAAKLEWAWPEGSGSARLRQLYQDLLTARRDWPALRDRRHTSARLLGTTCHPGRSERSRLDRGRIPRCDQDDDKPRLLIIERGGGAGLLAVANLTAGAQPITEAKLDHARLLLTTEDRRYGGSRAFLPSPFAKGAGGEGETALRSCESNRPHCQTSKSPSPTVPYPDSFAEAEGTIELILAHELLLFDRSGGLQ
jgi:maltooligosyltrehalose trehalohydrolase